MKSFADLFIKMFLHYSTQMMFRYQRKLEARLTEPSPLTGGLSNHVGRNSRIKPTVKESDRNSYEFEGFLSFFSRFISFSNNYLLNQHLLHLSLLEIERLIEEKRFVRSSSSFTYGAVHSKLVVPSSVNNYTEVGVLHENERSLIFLAKLTKLGQLVGYVYFNHSFEEEINPQSRYSITTVIPLKVILENGFSEGTAPFVTLWIVSFLKMIYPIYSWNSGPTESNSSTVQSSSKLSLFSQFREVFVLLWSFSRSSNVITSADSLSTLE
jgi:hypothetical protein